MGDQTAESCCLPLKQEFQRSKFSLHFEDPGIFCRSQWQRGDRSIIWVLYRWLMAAFFGTGVIWSMFTVWNGGRWFIFLSDWGFTLDFYTCTYGAVIATIYYLRPSYFAPGSGALKFYWISHYTTSVLSMLITLVFWAALASTMEDGVTDLYNLWSHAFNSIFMIFDCFMVAFPARIMFFIYPVCVVLVFLLHSLIYYFAGGTDMDGNRFIYYALDWARPGLAIGFVAGSLLLICCFAFVAFGIYRLRLSLAKCCCKNQVQPPAAKTVSNELA